QAFWARTIRWLATGGEFLPGQSMSLSLNPLRIEPGQSVQINVSTRYVEAADFSPSVQLIAPDGSTRDVTLTRGAQQSTQYQANVRMDQPGVHQVVLTDTKRDEAGEAVKMVGRLAVHDRSEEKRDT